MLKSFANGLSGGLGRFFGRLIGIGIVGYLAYSYIQKNNLNIDNTIDNFVEGVFYEKN